MVTLETERLVLRPFSEQDLDAYAAMTADTVVMRYVTDGRPLSRSEAWRQMAMFLGHWDLRGYGLWAAIEKASGTFIGRIGLWNPEGWPGLEVGWLLGRDFWGKGLATEGGRASIEYAFNVLDADHILSVIHPANAASIRVAEKLGAHFERTAVVNGVDVVIYGQRLPGRVS